MDEIRRRSTSIRNPSGPHRRSNHAGHPGRVAPYNASQPGGRQTLNRLGRIDRVRAQRQMSGIRTAGQPVLPMEFEGHSSLEQHSDERVHSGVISDQHSRRDSFLSTPGIDLRQPKFDVPESLSRNFLPEQLHDILLLQQKMAGSSHSTVKSLGTNASAESGYYDISDASVRPRVAKKQRCTPPCATPLSQPQSTQPAPSTVFRAKRKRSVAGLDVRVVLKCPGCQKIMGGGYKFGDYVQCSNCGENEFIVVREWSPGRDNRDVGHTNSSSVPQSERSPESPG